MSKIKIIPEDERPWQRLLLLPVRETVEILDTDGGIHKDWYNGNTLFDRWCALRDYTPIGWRYIADE